MDFELLPFKALNLEGIGSNADGINMNSKSMREGLAEAAEVYIEVIDSSSIPHPDQRFLPKPPRARIGHTRDQCSGWPLPL